MRKSTIVAEFRENETDLLIHKEVKSRSAVCNGTGYKQANEESFMMWRFTLQGDNWIIRES